MTSFKWQKLQNCHCRSRRRCVVLPSVSLYSCKHLSAFCRQCARETEREWQCMTMTIYEFEVIMRPLLLPWSVWTCEGLFRLVDVNREGERERESDRGGLCDKVYLCARHLVGTTCGCWLLVLLFALGRSRTSKCERNNVHLSVYECESNNQFRWL